MGVLQNIGSDSTGSIPSAAGRGAIHALIDKVPDEMLGQVKETVDRMLWRSQREKPFRNVEGWLSGELSPQILMKSRTMERSPGKLTRSPRNERRFLLIESHRDRFRIADS
jgi:hypothetical protein